MALVHFDPEQCVESFIASPVYAHVHLLPRSHCHKALLHKMYRQVLLE